MAGGNKLQKVHLLGRQGEKKGLLTAPDKHWRQMPEEEGENAREKKCGGGS